MKQQLILTVLALSIGAAHAQPPEAAQSAQLAQPTPEQQAEWQKQWEEEQREELRHPGTMIQAFVSAMSVSNFARAAQCVEGGIDDTSLARWRSIVRKNQGDWYLNVTPLFQETAAEKQGDEFTVRVTTSLRLRNVTVDKDTQKLVLSRLETLDLMRDGENWKIVPRPELKLIKTETIEGYDAEAIRARQIAQSEAEIATARNENDGIINDWARLMTKSPREMNQQLTQISVNNVKQLLLGILQLTQDYDEIYHFNAANWVEMTMPYVQNKNLFQMPIADDKKSSTYTVNPALYGISVSALNEVARTVAIYEAGDGPHGLNYQYDGQAVVGFVDGHVEMIGPDDLPKLIWEIRPTPSG